VKISGGLKEDGVVVGNAYDKYGSKNTIVRHLMRGFDDALGELVGIAKPESIHEVGCGEGYWVMQWREQGIDARGSDFSSQVIDIAQANAQERGIEASCFKPLSIYDLQAPTDSADLMVCCEVLEHLEDPEQGLLALKRVARDYVILSVPREPLWCALNMARGKYWLQAGNTPGHIRHWTKNGFAAFVAKHFEVLAIRSPLPWTMLLCRLPGQ
jgi:2-polyprenyl-3-methyl-5-hydroxy-6-metoxy-1,4-benzoquinol methylase